MDITQNRPGMQVVTATSERTVVAQVDDHSRTTVVPAVATTVGDKSATTDEAVAEKLEEIVDDMQDSVQAIQRNLSFSVDVNSGRAVLEVRDRMTGEMIRQLPSEQALKLAESLDELRSLLFKAQA